MTKKGSKVSKITRAVVTGASGFIGNALVERLNRRGVEVSAIDQYPSSRKICKSTLLDITEPDVLEKFIEEDTVIFHLAASANVSGSVDDPLHDFRNTLYGLIQVLETARKRNCRVIFPSTASIFDINNKLPVTEKSYVKPSSPYGAAKISGEAYCFAYFRCYGLDVRIARMFSVYGIGMKRFAIHDLVRKIQKNNKEISLLGDGNQIRDYLYIDDTAKGLELIATDGFPGEDYNLASGEQTRLIDLAKSISEEMGFPDIKITPTGESFPGDVPRWYGDITKIRGIGFSPNISIKAGLRKTIKWLQENK